MKLLKTAGTMGRYYGKKDMVFCLIFADIAAPYENYDYFTQSKNDLDKEKALRNIPMVLCQMRWDGKLGFPGGNVELHHKNLEEAVLAELEEEIGLVDINMDNLNLLATFADDKRHITSFSYKVTYEDLKKIQLNSCNAKHYYSENTGSILLQIHENSVPNLNKQFFAGTGLKELNLLINKFNLLEK